MKFNTITNYKRPAGEVNSGECLTETAGYISAKQRIENILLAGQRLADYRLMKYDANSTDDISDEDIPLDPTRSGGYDLADASTDLRFVTERISEIQNNLRNAQKNDPGITQQEPEAPDPASSDPQK